MSDSHAFCNNPHVPSSLPPLPPEVRFEPLGCPQEALTKANLLEGRTDTHKFEPAEVAIDQIRTACSPSQEQLEIWARHPDERVVIALLSSDLVTPFTRETKNILPHIASRAIQEARTRGEIWTPLLDALSGSIWFVANPLAAFDDRFQEDRYLETVVEPWIARQNDPGVLRRVILRSKSRRLIEYIARTARNADLALLDAALEACPSAMVDFANNDYLPRELEESLLDRMVAMTSQIEGNSPRDSHLADAFELLALRGVHLRPDHIERLKGMFETHVIRSDQSREVVCDRVLMLLTNYARDTGDEELSIQILDMATKLNHPSCAISLLDSYSRDSGYKATPRLARVALAHFGNQDDVIAIVAEHSHLRQDPEIRRHLLESNHIFVLIKLAEDKRPEEFLWLFKRLASISTNAAFNFLKQNRTIARRALSRTDLLPLLQADSHVVRLEAVAFLGELQEKAEIEAATSLRRFL